MFSKTNSKNSSKTSSKKNYTPTAAPDIPRKGSSRPSNNAPSILGRDIIVTGDIKTDGEVQIDGRHDGNISAMTVTVGENGVINGDIKAKAVLIRGKVLGKINAGSVELADTANVQADITQDKLIIANGAFFDGKSTRRKTATQPANISQAHTSKAS